jgi:hypothetical protein
MPARSLRAKLFASLAVVGLLAAAASSLVYSSFTSTVHNAGNTFQAGSVTLTADAPATALFSMPALKPGDTQARCVHVSYAAGGGLTSSVRMYGTTSGSDAHAGLDRYLALKVTRGSFAAAAPAGNACTGFVAGDVLFDDTLAAYPDSWQDGIVDPRAAWSHGDGATYRFELTLVDEDAAQGLDAGQQFSFEARNL